MVNMRDMVARLELNESDRSRHLYTCIDNAVIPLGNPRFLSQARAIINAAGDHITALTIDIFFSHTQAICSR